MIEIGEEKIVEKLDEIKNILKNSSDKVVAYRTRIYPMTYDNMEENEFAINIRRDFGKQWYEEMMWLRKKGIERMENMQRDITRRLYEYLREHLDGSCAVFYGEAEGYNIVNNSLEKPFMPASMPKVVMISHNTANDSLEKPPAFIPYRFKAPYYRIRVHDGNIDSSINVYHKLDTHDIGDENIAERLRKLADRYEVRMKVHDSVQIIYEGNVEDLIKEICDGDCKDAKIKDIFPNYVDESLLAPSLNISLKVQFAKNMGYVDRLTGLLKEFSYLYTYDFDPDTLKVALSGFSREEKVRAVETILKNRNSENTQQWLTENFPDISKELAIRQFCETGEDGQAKDKK